MEEAQCETGIRAAWHEFGATSLTVDTKEHLRRHRVANE